MVGTLKGMLCAINKSAAGARVSTGATWETDGGAHDMQGGTKS